MIDQIWNGDFTVSCFLFCESRPESGWCMKKTPRETEMWLRIFFSPRVHRETRSNVTSRKKSQILYCASQDEWIIPSCEWTRYHCLCQRRGCIQRIMWLAMDVLSMETRQLNDWDCTNGWG